MALESYSGVLMKDAWSTLVPFPTKFCVIAAKLEASQRAQGLTSWSSYGGALLAVVFLREQRQEFLGSAVMVAPGIAIAAKHVFEDQKPDLFASNSLFVLCGPQKETLEFWMPYSVTEIDGTDLLLISMDIASPIKSEHTIHGFRLSTRTPQIGEMLSVVGFRPSKLEFEHELGKPSHFGGSAYCGIGRVTAVYPDGRDRLMLPWPVFEIDCPSHGAMSGGAILDNTGSLIGILSTSFSMEDSTGPSYGSFLWSALDAGVKGGWRGLKPFSEFTTLRKLHNANMSCEILRADAVDTSKKGSGGFVYCHPWH